MSEQPINVAVVGATGAVGNEMINILEQRGFPVGDLRLLASVNSVGKRLSYKNDDILVDELTADVFEGIGIALFSAGAARSREFAPAAVRAGAVVIDNSSCFRMDPDVPLVVPEVNREEIFAHHGIIANPNCSTVQMVVCLKPIHDAVGIKRVVVSTYQSVSGTGKKAIEELAEQTRALLGMNAPVCNVYPHRIAFNCLPHIDDFTDSGYTKEEVKMVNETKKILGDASIRVTATTVRVSLMPTSCASLTRSAAAHGVVASASLKDSSLNTSATRSLKLSMPISWMPRISSAVYSRLFPKAVMNASGRMRVDRR